MTITVSSMTGTYTNGTANDGSELTTDLVALFNNDSTIATVVNSVTDSIITLAGVKTFGDGIKTDTVAEETSNNGVDIDGVLCKDGYVNILHASSPTSTEGDVWYDDTANVLKYRDNSGNKTVSTIAAIDDLSDVTITSVATGHRLYYNGTAWINYKPYESTGQTITSGALLTLPHGLGASPRWVTFYIQCTDAGGDGGWEQNEQLFVNPSNFIRSTSTPHGFVVTRNSTNLLIRFSSDTNVFFIENEDTGDSAQLTNSKWQLYAIAGL